MDLLLVDKPTMIFIGVSTAHSSMMKIFPCWAEYLGLKDCELFGVDLPIHAAPERYRECVEGIKRNTRIRGALVTTHKLDIFASCRDQFDEIEPLAASMGEISSIYKRGHKLLATATDPWCVGDALNTFVPQQYWRYSNAEALILGAGGSSIALAWHLSKAEHGINTPSSIHVADICQSRLEHLEELHTTWSSNVSLTTYFVSCAEDNDALLAKLPPGSLVVNATGLGKDAPGSPLSHAAVFPEQSLAWEFNYRGNLVFLQQARAQQQTQRLHIEDGWDYFVQGWIRVIADVFDLSIATSGPQFEKLKQLANEHRG
jgi:shikimate 5-dehydrogenase